MVELEEKVSELESWTDGKGLIVQGAAGTFCSGSDLNAVRAISNPQVAKRSSCIVCRCCGYMHVCCLLRGRGSLIGVSVALQDGMKMCILMQNALTRLLR